MDFGKVGAASKDFEEAGPVVGDPPEEGDPLEYNADRAGHEKQQYQQDELAEQADLEQEGASSGMLGEETAKLLESWAPETIQLPKGRPAKIHYDAESPWLEARLQEFWGLKKSPAIAGGAVPLVLHLLAPNMRAVQVTTDLKGFWERVYKELRPGLSRRYPKHHWPE